ncbi:uncharacterized protein LOC111831438 [Capsella rubella]|uniref:uncharacterized protein LOC111831438 n=1 Tax=Capsella rubella TaxID=81985 RepID=UPI000CD4D80B|nr:uncharacterized protein LOC111831438 [Capsella rubella]
MQGLQGRVTHTEMRFSTGITGLTSTNRRFSLTHGLLNLFDLRHSGNFLSWRGKRNELVVHCRLDRAMSNSSWAEVYPFSRCEYMRFEGSDHRPLLTHLDLTKKRKKGIFRYDRRLKDSEELTNIIKSAWTFDSEEGVEEKISRCRSEIISWTKQKYQNSQKLIEKLKEELEDTMSSQETNQDLISSINIRLLHAYKAEEEFWKQRSRQLWLTLGDKNTGYFHAITRNRAVINKFSVIEDKEGQPIHSEEGILQVISDYFSELFTSIDGDRNTTIQTAIHPCITEEINQKLTILPSPEEIKRACFSIHADKAPGPDGFSASFFQTNWETVGPNLIIEIQSFFSSACLQTSINKTHVRLIPKTRSPQKMTEYRPIALCTVFYKIISKLLSRRLQPVLQAIISENQSAFVPKRAISDNVLITHEALHYLKTSKAKKMCFMAVKTDMSKAYDRIEWDFIRLVMERMGFHPKWIKWIMQCISTVSYSFLLNGAAQGSVVPQRGIRQGDPLSPYIFILCSEVLSGLCTKAQMDGTLPGLRVAMNSPRINHLLFADDTMFFCRSDAQSCKTLLHILKVYETASGQKINKEKSAITFSSKTGEHIKLQAQRILGIQRVGGLGKYLGLPEMFGRKKRDLFNQIIDNIRQRALSWSSRFLSIAGKAIMLKSVLAAMPTYTMSCFKLPGSLCNRIQSALTRFWWDSSAENKKMSWIAWSKMTKSKRDGGLGFRDITAFNDALLAKISWRLLTKPSCLLARILLGKYCPSNPFLSCSVPASASHGWRGICIGRDLISSQLGRAIGSGITTSVWYDPWISLTSPVVPMGPVPEKSQNLKVSELICPISKEWDKAKISLILPQYEQDILSLRPSKLGAEDKYIWLPTKTGEYSAKSGYHEASKEDSTNLQPIPRSEDFNWLKEIWNIRCSPKVKFLLWKAMRNAIPSGKNLKDRGINREAVCPHCGEDESNLHLFFHCTFARKIWELAPLKSPIHPTLVTSLKAGIELTNRLLCLPPLGIGHGNLSPWIMWMIWISRNKKIFEHKQPNSADTLTQAIILAKEWNMAQSDTSSNPKPHLDRTLQFVDADSIRIFSDAAWREDSKEAGFGWIWMDTVTGLESHGSSTATNVCSPLMAESIALLLALKQALNLGFQKVIFASDSQLLIKALNAEPFSKELYGIHHDILLLSLNFIECNFTFVKREQNMKADGVAKSALLSLSSVTNL